MASETIEEFRQREEAYRANNLGVALMEQFSFKEAALEFRRAIRLFPDLKIARINLAISLFNIPDYEQARIKAEIAAKVAPNQPQPFYMLGQIARHENRIEEAVEIFQKVLKFDQEDVGANINLAQIYIQQKKYTEAERFLRKALENEPYNTTALYNLATTLNRTGKREEGLQFMARFQTLRNSGAGTSVGLNYLEQGRFAETLISNGAESGLVDKNIPKVTFQAVEVGLPKLKPGRLTEKSNSNTTNAAALFDYDNDGDADLVVSANKSKGLQLLRNDKGKFLDVEKTSGDLARPIGIQVAGLIAGDYDNDGLIDLFAFGKGQPLLFRQLENGIFKNVTDESKLPHSNDLAVSAAFVDVDHDGDLDIFLGGFSDKPNKLWRNNGNGIFADISETSRLNLPSRTVAVIPTDFDNRRDVDLMLLNKSGKPELWQNLRDSSFRNITREVNLNQTEQWTCAAIGDLNKDSFSDFFFGRNGEKGVFAISDGRGKFILNNAPKGTENAHSAQILDYDNDGLLDLIAVTPKGLVLTRNLGDSWTEANSQPFKTNADFSASKQMLSADLDSDGDLDLLVFGKNGTLRYLQNRGGEINNSKTFRLTGRVSNKTGIGAKIDLRAGSLSQKLESYSASPSPAPAEIHFGLGKREIADAVRIIWTSGVIQAETEFPQTQAKADKIKIEEIDRKPSSCPYLFAWNGEKFEFITDFLGGGEMGYSFGNGQVNTPDADEFVRLTSDQLKAKNGKYELRITNELEEVLYLDHFKLTAVDHPQNTEIYPNEGSGIPSAGKSLIYTTANEHPPLKATDRKGRDILDQISALDRNYFGSFESEKIRGYAKPHELTLTLDERYGFNDRTLLLLTGWTDYAFSSDNIAAAQVGLRLQPPKLQVRDKQGNWQTVIDSIGFSVGRPQTVVVDLTGKFLSASREVRILTNMKTLWDKIAVDTSADASQNLKVSNALPAEALLRERGFSLEIKPDGREPVLADYQQVANDGRWKFFSGTFTRIGEVLPLITQADDVFVISKTGDELILTFDENDFPTPAWGMKRTFLLYGVGYSKEMDINSASPDTVFPLPFRTMTKYPYSEDEEFPMNEEKKRIYDKYTTRRGDKVIPRIETVLLK